MIVKPESGTVIPATIAGGVSVGLRVLNRPNKPWIRIEDASDPERLSILVNKEQLLAALKAEGILPE